MKLLVVSILDVDRKELMDIARVIAERGGDVNKKKKIYDGLIKGNEYEYVDSFQLTRYSLYDEDKIV